MPKSKVNFILSGRWWGGSFKCAIKRRAQKERRVYKGNRDEVETDGKIEWEAIRKERRDKDGEDGRSGHKLQV